MSEQLTSLRLLRDQAYRDMATARDRRDARTCYACQQEITRLGILIRDLEHPSTVPESRR